METINTSTNRLKDRFGTIFIVLYMFLSFISLYEIQMFIVNTSIVAIAGVLFVWNFNYIKREHLKLLIVALCFAAYSFICLYLFQGKLTFTPLRIIVHFSFFILAIHYNISAKAIKWVLYLYILYILYLLFVQGIYINAIFPGTSKNIIGWFALGICVFYYLLVLKDVSDKKSLGLFPAIATLLICLISLSRSNIICAFILLFGVLSYYFKYYSLVKKTGFLLIGTALVVFFLYFFYDLLEIGLQRFDERGLESADRTLFLDSYIEKLNFYTFLLGVNSNQYPFTLINGNFHNSFLLGHSNFGILFFFFIVFIVQLLFRKLSTSLFLVILALVLLIRAYTDTIMFIGYFDFILFTTLYKIYKS